MPVLVGNEYHSHKFGENFSEDWNLPLGFEVNGCFPGHFLSILSAASPDRLPLPVNMLSTEIALPFEAAQRGLRFSLFEMNFCVSDSHSLVLMIVLNPYCHYTLNLCENSSHILSDSSCLWEKPPRFWFLLMWQDVLTHSHMPPSFFCSSSSTGGTLWTEPPGEGWPTLSWSRLQLCWSKHYCAAQVCANLCRVIISADSLSKSPNCLYLPHLIFKQLDFSSKNIRYSSLLTAILFFSMSQSFWVFVLSSITCFPPYGFFTSVNLISLMDPSIL